MTIDELFEIVRKLDRNATRDGVTLSAGGYLDLGSLTTLPEGVTLSAGGSLDLGSLTTLPEGVTLSAGGYLYARVINQQWRGKRLRSVDGYLMEFISSVESDGFTIHNCRYFGREDACRVTEKGGVFAHGSTAKEAVSDLLFKLATGDIPSVVAEIKSTGKVTRVQYRAITGACQDGTSRFLESHGLADTQEMPLEEVLRVTHGAYGFEKFREAVM